MRCFNILLIFCLTYVNQISIASAQAEGNGDLDVKLFEALQNDDLEAVTKALDAGANINALSERGKQTPLMQSVLHGKEKMVKFFLEKGADTSIPEKDGYTPMHGAGFQGRSTIAAMLHEKGVGLRDKHPRDGYEPAIRSCWGPEQRHTETVNFFLSNGVPLDDIYDDCMSMTSNEATKELLSSKKKLQSEQEKQYYEL